MRALHQAPSERVLEHCRVQLICHLMHFSRKCLRVYAIAYIAFPPPVLQTHDIS